MALVLVMRFCLLVLTGYAYVITQTQLSWNVSSHYCQSHCLSELASINNQNDMLFAVKTINDSLSQNYYSNLDIWIGLNDLNNDTQFTWIDKTRVTNWANNNSLTNTKNYCVEMDSTSSKFNWDTANCDEAKRSLCNECDSKLTKFIAIHNVYANFSTAEDYCVETLHTHLASIYSSRDMFEAQQICKLSTVNTAQSCWIGLINHSAADYNFTWTDNAVLQFGATFKTFPWQNDEPTDWANEKCVKLYEPAQYLWNNVPCSQYNYFLCNLPSEICSSDAIWHTAQMPSTFVFSCDLMYDRITINGDYFSVIQNKQWDNHGNELLLEFRFAIHHFLNYQTGTVGITLFNLGSMCEYFYIAISCNDIDLKCSLFIRKYTDDKPILLAAINYETYLELQSDPNKPFAFNTLLITVTNEKIEALLNDNWMVSADINEMDRQNTTLSGYIGIRGEHSMLTAKSLYVSGTQIIDSNNLFSNDQCNMTYNVVPLPNITAGPTDSPTKSPVPQPTYDITYGVIISITFMYTSDTNITSLLRNITQTIINNQIIDIADNCVLSNDYNINIHEKQIDGNHTQTLINATIFVCDETAETQLNADFENNLEHDFIGKIPQHLVVVTDIHIDVDVIGPSHIVIHTTVQMYNTDNNGFGMGRNSNSIIIIVSILISLIILSVAALLIWKCVQQRKMLAANNPTKIENNGTIIQMIGNKTKGFQLTTSNSIITPIGTNDTGNNSEDEMYEAIATPNRETVKNDLNMPDMDMDDDDDINEMFTQSPTQQTTTAGHKVPQVYTGDGESDSDEEIYKNHQNMRDNAKSLTVEGGV